uniref:Pupal cuticle protein Edg-84A n=1 Tax=Glossina austeni TaxID=7395 RepID=A0A1A9VQS9_GLOAU
MDFKVIALIACFALVNGAVLPESTISEKLEHYDSHPSYKFSYNVQDELTGDFKSQTEIRDGDLVQGEYSLREADGSIRTVEYTADAENGFKAHVIRGPAEIYNKQTLAKMAAIELPAPTSPSTAIPQPSTTPITVQSPVKDKYAVKTYVQPAAYIRTYTSPTLVHHQPSVIHAPPATVHLTPTTHFVHAAPAATATLLKTAAAAPAVITHHTPTVVKTTSITSPHHVSYVHYH